MNERIKRIAEQAEDSVDWGGPNNDDDYKRALAEWQEKFGKLLVKECMMLCGAVAGAAELRLGKNSEFGLGAGKCEALIKEHFGVDE